jgi:hypothetical protein
MEKRHQVWKQKLHLKKQFVNLGFLIILLEHIERLRKLQSVANI